MELYESFEKPILLKSLLDSDMARVKDLGVDCALDSAIDYLVFLMDDSSSTVALNVEI